MSHNVHIGALLFYHTQKYFNCFEPQMYDKYFRNAREEKKCMG